MLALVASVALLSACSSEQDAQAVTTSQAQPVQSVGASVDDLKAIFPTLQGRHNDTATGEIVLDILAADADAATLNENKAAAERLLGAPVRLSVLPAPLQQQPSQ